MFEFTVIIMLLIYYTGNCIVSALVLRNLLHSTRYNIYYIRANMLILLLL